MCGILRRSCGLTSLCMKNTSIKKIENVGKSEDVLYTKDLNVDDEQNVFKIFFALSNFASLFYDKVLLYK